MAFIKLLKNLKLQARMTVGAHGETMDTSRSRG